MEMEVGLDGLEDLALHIILLKLGPEDTVKVSSVSKKLRLYTSEDSLWAKFCFQDLHLSTPQDHQGNPAPSFKVIGFYITIFKTLFLSLFISWSGFFFLVILDLISFSLCFLFHVCVDYMAVLRTELRKIAYVNAPR